MSKWQEVNKIENLTKRGNEKMKIEKTLNVELMLSALILYRLIFWGENNGFLSFKKPGFKHLSFDSYDKKEKNIIVINFAENKDNLMSDNMSLDEDSLSARLLK